MKKSYLDWVELGHRNRIDLEYIYKNNTPLKFQFEQTAVEDTSHGSSTRVSDAFPNRHPGYDVCENPNGSG